MSHTPGPWVVAKGRFNCACSGICNKDSIGSVVAEAEGIYIAKIEIDAGDSQSVEFDNARLIASAPELLEALCSAVEELDLILNHYQPEGRHESDLSATRELLPKLKAAIAKAEGRV